MGSHICCGAWGAVGCRGLQARFFFFFFFRLGSGRTRAHLASLLLLCLYARRVHMATVWNTDYIINITHRLRNTQLIFACISIQVTVNQAEHQGEVGAWGVTKSSQCFGKSCILDHPCHLMMILTRRLLIGCAFREKCIFRDFIMKEFLFSIQIISF